MRPRLLAIVLSIAASAGVSGCMSQPDARYIYQDGEFGVIGIPQNSPYGKKDYLAQAEELMRRHFPEGHEVVRAEEVVEGQRVLDKSKTRAIETDPAITALNQRINFGKLAQTTATQQKDSLPILESRIIYKRKSRTEPQGNKGFSALATLTPALYLDPNEMSRCRERIELAEMRKERGKGTAVADKSKDAQTKQASADGSKKE